MITEWANVGEKAGAYSVDMDTGAHWVAILFSMNITSLSDIRPLVSSPAASIVSLILLALSYWSRSLCEFVFSAPLGSRATRDASFKQSPPFLALVAMLLVGAWHVFWPRRQDSEQARASDHWRDLSGM